MTAGRKTWAEFIRGKMGPLMKKHMKAGLSHGKAHGAAIREIAAEWKKYKEAHPETKKDGAEDIRRRFRFLERKKRPTRMPPPLPLRNLERAHRARIINLIKPYEDLIRAELLPVIDIIVSETNIRVDDPTTIVERIFNDIRVRFAAIFTPQAIERATRDTSTAINSASRRLFSRQFKTLFSVDPLAAEPWLEQEVSTFVAENASLIKTLPDEAISDIEQMVFRDARRGLSPQQIRANILEQFNVTRARAQLIARDQVSKFNGRLSELRQKQTGITRYEWQTSEDGRVREDHARLNGEIFSWDDPPITVRSGKRSGERNHPGQDIQCFPGDTPVSFLSGTNKAYRHWYSGELTEIVTDTGITVRSTPNHPMLTDTGWVEAHHLKVGDNLIEAPSQRSNVLVKNPERCITKASKVFSALAVSGDFHRISAITSWFHGDMTDKYVDIVNVDRGLLISNVSTRIQSIRENFFTFAAKAATRLCHTTFDLIAAFTPSYGFVGSGGQSHALTLAGLPHPFIHRITTPTTFDAEPDKHIGYRPARTLESATDRELTFPGAIQTYNLKLRKIKSVMRRPWSGWVYNFETTGGWYLAHGLVSHNCRCQAIPVIKDLL